MTITEYIYKTADFFRPGAVEVKVGRIAGGARITCVYNDRAEYDSFVKGAVASHADAATALGKALGELKASGRIKSARQYGAARSDGRIEIRMDFAL